MPVQFILGRSGTGKTTLCINQIIQASSEEKANRPLILLVPEQATYQAERAILADKKTAGFAPTQYNTNQPLNAGLNIISFSKLQFLLFKKRTAKPQISRIGRQMIIQKILTENQTRLELLNTSANQPGLSRLLQKTIEELHQYDKDPQDIEALVEKIKDTPDQNLAAKKFKDIGLLLNKYCSFVEDKFIDPDLQLRKTQKAIEANSYLKDVKLWIDGFASFTNTQLNILAELMKKSRFTKIALCLDAEKVNLGNPQKSLSPVKLFYQTEKTYAQLSEIIKQLKLKTETPVILKTQLRLKNNKALRHIEENLFKAAPPRIPAENNIKILSAPDARTEVKSVAKEILKLVKSENYRYRDIAVIVSDIESYQHYIKAYFEDYQIPFFIDQRQFLSQHPLANLICSALEVVTNDFNKEEVFAYLKNNLVGADRKEIDLLENYCLAFGITVNDWRDPQDWDFAPEKPNEFDQEEINRIRKNLLTPLLKLKENLMPCEHPDKKINARNFVKSIFDFLNSLNVSQRLALWSEPQQNESSTPNEHSQFYNNIIDLFDELLEVFGEAKTSPQGYLSILKSAFSQLTLAFIPPKLDEVLIGSIERSRHPDLKIAFLIGATQQQFPQPVKPSGLLTDQDRTVAETADFQLAPDSATQLVQRQYLAYIALTRPSEKLYISYPCADQKANAVIRSQFIDHLQELFEDLNEEHLKIDETQTAEICNKEELTEALCTALGKDNTSRNQQLEEIFCEAESDDLLAPATDFVRSAIEYQNAPTLQSDILPALFPKKLNFSASRLAVFASCPYRYFAQYSLELQERKEFKFEPINLGDFYHRILDKFITCLIENNISLKESDEKELLKILRGQISKVIEEDGFISRFKNHSPQNTFIITTAGEKLEEFIPSLAQMAKQGQFKPFVTELAFGKLKGAKQNIPEYQIILPENRKVSIRGKIDRLDTAEINGQRTALIFDYKRNPNKTSFNWSKFFHGLDLQLPIYILAIKNAANSKINIEKIAGAFYIPIEPDIKSTNINNLQKEQEKFGHKAKGIFDGNFAKHLDVKASGNSNFYNFYMKSDGSQYGNYNISGALKPDDFEQFLKFAERKIRQLAQELLSGKIEITPYKLSSESPCRYCKYKPLCRFDWNINDYNYLQSQNKTEFLEGLGAKV